MKVVVTGAAGQISYSLIPFLCEKGIFNSNEKLDLNLVEIPQAMDRLNGFVKELEDSAYSTVSSISTFDNIENAVQDVLNDGLRTKDIAEKGKKEVSTKEMGDAVISKLK